MVRQQQNCLEHIVPCDLIDKRIEERPAADIQHRLQRCRGSVPKRHVKPPGQDDSRPSAPGSLDEAAKHVPKSNV
jgi:hypothetical protein